jgi:hypothetical protein
MGQSALGSDFLANLAAFKINDQLMGTLLDVTS